MTKTTLTFIQFSFYTIFIFFPVSHTNAQLYDREHAVLLKIKQLYWQNPLSIDSHWASSNSSHCSWPGVTCTNGSVTGLSFVDKNITRTVLPFICDLKNLTVVDLSYNYIDGDFPKALYNCSKLQYLDLSQNYLNGTIPDDIFNMSRLQFLSLGANDFSGNIPKALYNCSTLEYLDLSQNFLNGTIPDDISNMGRLLYLSLGANGFSGNIPKALYNCSKLQYLDPSQNSLNGTIPDDIFNVGRLQYLSLGANGFNIPNFIYNCSKLQYLDLSQNFLNGTIPDYIFNMGRLQYLSLGANDFSGYIPVSIGRNVSFSGNIPVGVFSWRNMVLVTGTIPLELTTLLLDQNHLSGSFPSNIISWRPLNILNLSRNELSGKISKELDSLPGLTDLDLSKNQLSGEIPSQKLEKQFLVEVKILSLIGHSNLVKLLCFISSNNLKLLVYEYSENHTQNRWLHKKGKASSISGSIHHVVLDWPKRLHIAVGAAKGLTHMHHDCSPPIVHRDVKSSNILLDSEFNAIIADFGLAKILTNQGESATMSVVAGSSGYIALEYAHTTRVNEKIDVYSFGVILLELATGKEDSDGDEHTSLAEWAWRHIEDGNLVIDDLDKEIKEPCYIDEMCNVFQIDVLCTEESPSKRPSMKDVLRREKNTGSEHEFLRSNRVQENDDVGLEIRDEHFSNRHGDRDFPSVTGTERGTYFREVLRETLREILRETLREILRKTLCKILGEEGTCLYKLLHKILAKVTDKVTDHLMVTLQNWEV